eukprot:2715985-Amphidinium_carterae.1
MVSTLLPYGFSSYYCSSSCPLCKEGVTGVLSDKHLPQPVAQRGLLLKQTHLRRRMASEAPAAIKKVPDEASEYTNRGVDALDFLLNRS